MAHTVTRVAPEGGTPSGGTPSGGTPSGGIPSQAAGAILAAAARLFAGRGYDSTSMREIAEAARVTKPTIYYYFKSKSGLFDALLESAASSLCGDLESINGRDASSDAAKCLEDAVFAGFRFAREHSDLNRFIHGLVFSPPMRAERRAIEKAFSRVTAEFRKVLVRAADGGLVEKSRIPSAAVALRGSMLAHIVDYLHGSHELTPRLAADIVNGLLHGYGSRRDESQR